jgi:glycosyltransferase involved in cell wall biosynthesis
LTQGALLAGKPVIIFWAPVTLDPSISGDKINEVERVRVLSRNFTVYSFFLISLRNLRKSRVYVRDWFSSEIRTVTVLPGSDTMGLVILSTFASAMVVALQIILRKLVTKMDLVICRGPVQSIPVIVACRLLGVKVLYNALSVPFGYKEMELTWDQRIQNPYTAYMMKSFDYFVLRNADYVAVSNEQAARELVASFGACYRSKLLLLPHPIPDKFFDYTPRIEVGNEIELLYHGSISRLYDFASLLLAVNKMNAAGRKVVLTVYTSKQNRDSITRDRSYDPAFVRLKDELPREQIADIISQTTAVVVPYSSLVQEGLSIKALEAMAIGVPVITTNPRDSKIFRDHETCLVVKDAPDSWERAILRTTQHELRERLIREARAQVQGFRSGLALRLIADLCQDKSSVTKRDSIQ